MVSTYKNNILIRSRDLTCEPINKGLNRIFKNQGLKFVYKSIGKFTNLLDKTKIPTSVYEIACTGCDKKYVGQTHISIRTRTREHTRPMLDWVDRKIQSSCKNFRLTVLKFK